MYPICKDILENVEWRFGSFAQYIMLFVYFSMVVHLISVILSATLYVGFSAGGYTDLDYSK